LNDRTEENRTGQDRNVAERLIDELLPEDLDWESLVRSYPVPCLLAAGAFGFVVGRNHGSAILGALVSFAGYRASQAIEEVLDHLPGDENARDDGYGHGTGEVH
jgi:hypothetical protein